MISELTKAALAAAKKRGVKLGGYRDGARLTAKIRKAGNEANAARLRSGLPMSPRSLLSAQVTAITDSES